ncbi:MAG: ABC transporter substrate-binding protein [Bacillota bacterium]
MRWKRSLALFLLASLAVTAALGASTVFAAKSQLVVYSWWTAGGEADGLNALIQLYTKKYPDVEFVNATVAGGAGTNAKAVLKTRMLGGDPPDSFQVHGGSELIDTWVKTGYMEPITQLYKDNGWLKVFPKSIIDMLSYKGEIYAVPVNVHRGNCLWYNKKLFAEYKLTPPTTFDDFFKVAEKFKAKGIPALALASRTKWEVAHLFEDILLGTGGPKFYNDLFAGKIAWTDARVKKALNTLKKMLDYVNADHATLTWDQACGLVLQGKAAMTIMGDWAKGYFTSNGWKPNVDFGVVPSPGTKGMFVVVNDSFGLPKKAKNRENCLKWLALLGSVEGQNAFNPLKGSIPARTDVPRTPYDPIALATMDDFAKDTLVPSCVHGSAVIDSFASALNDEMGVFVNERNVEATAKRLEQQAKDLGVRQ